MKHRDDVEDDELVVNQFTEGMPTTLGGFKDHPLFVTSISCFAFGLTRSPSYVLERHLLRDQIISEDARELGTFRGESVYSRSQVLQLKAAENWMRSGRVVRAGEQPLKYVKHRAVTLSRRRELEIRAGAGGANGSGEVMQGLYAERQTEKYVPPPVIDVCFLFGRHSIPIPNGVPFLRYQIHADVSSGEYREGFRRIILGTLICTRRLCFQLELHLSHVRFVFANLHRPIAYVPFIHFCYVQTKAPPKLHAK